MKPDEPRSFENICAQGPELDYIWTTKVGRSRPQHRSKSKQIWPNPGRIGRCWPGCPKAWANLAQTQADSAGVGPISAEFGSVSAFDWIWPELDKQQPAFQELVRPWFQNAT